MRVALVGCAVVLIVALGALLPLALDLALDPASFGAD